jgi:hypothetical protein
MELRRKSKYVNFAQESKSDVKTDKKRQVTCSTSNTNNINNLLHHPQELAYVIEQNASCHTNSVRFDTCRITKRL